MLGAGTIGRGSRQAVVAVLLAVAAVLLAAFLASVAGAKEEEEEGFGDVPGNLSHSAAIEILSALDVLDGTECGPARFCPREPLRRWEMAVWLVRVLDGEEPAPDRSADFVDVPDRNWWTGHVDRLAELEITFGCSSKPARFCPYRAVTRGQMATFLTRAFDLEPRSSVGFTDVEGHVHAGNINALAAADITAGCATDPSRYCPGSAVTRGQMATFLARALGVVPSAEFSDVVAEHDIRHLVSSYTTHHPCCQARVTNIQRFADIVHGAVVPPWERLSLNRHVGKRTREKGFRYAGTLIGGELVNTVGGGVSQFATTFYNAMFWGGYRDVSHKPHSLYFPRYPEGIEATINWPDVDLVFRNDTPAYVLIATEYTDTSVTVKFFGDNDGRIVVGDWKSDEGILTVVSEGGPRARVVSADVSGRSRWTSPPPPLIRGNPELAVGEEKQVQSARQGWTVLVTRTIDQGGTRSVREWTVRYSPRQRIVEVHPCVLSGSCPESDETPEDTGPPVGGAGHGIPTGYGSGVS
ncbi:MAG: VanW family protein [bacterium]|nr:VanW family protein [bacterium]MDE0286961.1 VanW family protein [bacterium]MDE0437247.1 VanW family protein [bacterium]